MHNHFVAAAGEVHFYGTQLGQTISISSRDIVHGKKKIVLMHQPMWPSYIITNKLYIRLHVLFLLLHQELPHILLNIKQIAASFPSSSF